MTNKELMQALAAVRGLLYSRPFGGDQMMVVSECVRIIDTIIAKTNEQNLDAKLGDDND